MSSLPPVRLALPDSSGRGYSIEFRSLSESPARLREAGLRAGPCLLITDDNVAVHYLAPLQSAIEADGWTPHPLVVPAGEASKSADQLGAVYDWALGLGTDRRTPE